MKLASTKRQNYSNSTEQRGGLNKGFDAIDGDGKRVQIKSRILYKSQERMGVFNNYDFDYALLVLMSENYDVVEIHKATRRSIKSQIESQKYKKASLSVGKFKQLARQVYP